MKLAEPLVLCLVAVGLVHLGVRLKEVQVDAVAGYRDAGEEQSTRRVGQMGRAVSFEIERGGCSREIG